MKKLRLIFGLLAAIIAIYNLIILTFYYDSSRTDNFKALPFMNFFLGLFMLVTGFSELKSKRKINAVKYFICSILLIFVSIKLYTVYY
ncbi:MAG: DUF3953 domain-containing protein [Candidatus Pristimantibacillus lignocellulolyticus]|uniref:DUF3953 domain-containing protein n=1 Tax=Candidatus Pristimantibacillus lignocellulolyticus TaxID=2994561 RepID=A0A9J6ZBW2_9BACL|nr:MAG: DUF3953 domain-containing protein [Candidatus Pristimantibacillus lignocellulolyticus]